MESDECFKLFGELCNKQVKASMLKAVHTATNRTIEVFSIHAEEKYNFYSVFPGVRIENHFEPEMTLGNLFQTLQHIQSKGGL